MSITNKQSDPYRTYNRKFNSLGKFEINIIVGFKSKLIKKKLSKYKNKIYL